VYTFPDIGEPIRQGDIFRWLPKLEIVLGSANLPLLVEPEKEGVREIDWFQLAQSGSQTVANALVKPVLGIVITQDCDAERCVNVAFAEVRPFSDIYVNFSDDSKTGAVVDIVTEHSRKNQKWYYLADNNRMGFERKMGVDFLSVFEVNREMLEMYKDRMRLGRLDDNVAWPHFRERVAEFFRRYPYNEWYPLNLDEVNVYEQKHGGNKVDPYYPWQT